VNYEDGSTHFPRRCKPPLYTYTSTQGATWGAIKAPLGENR
jgi:hypothetical protein